MSKERKTPAVLGLDMGGTHTDAVLLRGGTLLASVKVPTNHQDLLVSTREALHALFESGAAFPADVSRATFGTTLAVNAVVHVQPCAQGSVIREFRHLFGVIYVVKHAGTFLL